MSVLLTNGYPVSSIVPGTEFTTNKYLLKMNTSHFSILIEIVTFLCLSIDSSITM